MSGYTIFGGELSYFSRKLEAAMIAYGLDFAFVPKSPDRAQEIEMRAGCPAIVNWADSTADGWSGDGSLAAFPELSNFARFIVDEMRETYVSFALGNRNALLSGAKAFHVDTYGEEVSYLCRPYPERSRQMIVSRIRSMTDDEQQLVGPWLEAQKLSALFPELFDPAAPR